MNDLTHLLEDVTAASFVDSSIDLNNYLKDSVFLKLNADNKYYVGLYKPFENLFLDLKAGTELGSNLSIKYYNGTSFVAVPNLSDESKSFSRSGFITWEFDEDDITNEWIESTINSKEAYWIEITGDTFAADFISSSLTGNTLSKLFMSASDVLLYTVGQNIYCEDTDSYHAVESIDLSVSTESITVSPALLSAFPDNSKLYNQILVGGNNMVFANDDDLIERYENIESFKGESGSFIGYHQSSRKDLIQDIRNSRTVKISNSTKIKDITLWDFLRPEQVRNAAAYLCLSKIYAGTSDSTEGKFLQLSKMYNKDYESALSTYLLNLDLNDDGEESASEVQESIKLTRIKFV